MPKTPERAAFGVYPQAGKRGRKPNAKSALEQAFSDERAMSLPQFGEVDLDVPTAANRALGQRMVARDVDLKRQADRDMSPLEKLAGGIQTGRLIGSGLTQAIKSIPTAITKGGKAAEDYIAENIYQPTQPKAYEYAGDIADFLTSLETNYKLPPVLPEAVAIQSLLGPATRQAGKAVKQGAKQGALNLAAPRTLNPQAGVFIGPKAKTFHQGKADMAVAMEEAGRTPQEIWQATGTFRGADGILRQEIDDRAAKFLSADERKERIEAAKGKIAEMREKIKPTPQKDLFPKALTEAKKEVRDDISILKSDVEQRQNNPRTQGLLAAHIFEHPELYAAYPELQNVKIVTEGGSGGNARGSLSIMPSRGFYPGSMEIDVYDKGLRGDPTSTTLHEMQHAVQTLEGMGPGGNPTFAFQNPEAHGMLHKERMNMLKGLSYDDFVRQAGYTDMEQAGKDYIKYTNDLKKGIDPAYDRMLQERVAMEYYKRLLGEAEARAVQERQMMTPSQRMDTPPPASYDVPQEDLIVKPPREYADGGRVYFSDNPDVMQLELAGGGLVKGLKAAAKAMKAPQEDAMRLAQQRAALPKEKGGLGLPANNTPEQRAKAMGFDRDTFHGSLRDIKKLDPRLGSTESHAGRGIYSTDSPEDASLNYANIYGPDVAGRVERGLEERDKDFRKIFGRMRDEVLTPRQQEIILRNTAGADNLGVVYPLKVRSDKSIHLDAPEENPIRIGPFERYDEVADAYVDTPETAKFREALDEFGELGGEANPIYEVVQDGDGPVPARDVFNAVKKTGNESGLYDPYTGDIVSGGVAAGDFVKHFGIDEIRHTPEFRNQQLNIGSEHTISLNPDNVRSRFAAFDPFRKDAATAAAMGVLAPDLLAKEKDKEKGKGKGKEDKKSLGGAVQMQAGGLAKAIKAAKAAKEAPMKASEALGRIEGRPLIITQADRTKVGGGYLGGPGFSGLQLEDPAYRAAEAAWAVKNPGTAKMILGGRGEAKDPVYAAMLGTPTQHQSNQMVFDKLYGDFKKAAKKGGLDPELRDRINMRLANTVDKEGNPIFPPDVDILDKKFKELASTFDRRSVTANLIGGMGVGGKKGQIIDYDKIIRQTTDPMLLESPTGAIGNRLFTLSGGVIERPDLHPAFPTIMQGEDLGVSFDPVARELIMKDFMEKTMREKGRAPGYMDYTRGYPPSQLITEDLLTELQKMGKKAGGEVKAPAAQIDGNQFVVAAQKYGLGDDMATLNKMVSLVNQGATVDEAARVLVGGGVRKAAGGEITADDLILEERKL